MLNISSYLDDLSQYIENELKKFRNEKSIEYVENIHKEVLKLERIAVEELKFSEKSLAIEFINVLNQLCIKGKNMLEREIQTKYIQRISDLMEYLIKHSMKRCFYNSVSTQAHKFSIAAIMRNERYIIEWIEYHRIVGVEHFYIYDNESTDGLKEKLKGYIEEGIVTYTYFPGDEVQIKAYQHAIENYKYDTKWLAIIDGDEFIVPVENVLLPDLCDDIELKFHNIINVYIGGIIVNSRTYGTSYHKNKMQGLCIENYTRRGENEIMNALVKTIVNPRVVQSADIHYCRFIENYYGVTENGTPSIGDVFFEGTCSKIRINHYYSKSEEEFLEKLNRGWPDQQHVKMQEKDIDYRMKQAVENFNKVEDFIIERYVEKVSERVKNYEQALKRGERQ